MIVDRRILVLSSSSYYLRLASEHIESHYFLLPFRHQTCRDLLSRKAELQLRSHRRRSSRCLALLSDRSEYPALLRHIQVAFHKWPRHESCVISSSTPALSSSTIRQHGAE